MQPSHSPTRLPIPAKKSSTVPPAALKVTNFCAALDSCCSFAWVILLTILWTCSNCRSSDCMLAATHATRSTLCILAKPSNGRGGGRGEAALQHQRSFSPARKARRAGARTCGTHSFTKKKQCKAMQALHAHANGDHRVSFPSRRAALLHA